MRERAFGSVVSPLFPLIAVHRSPLAHALTRTCLWRCTHLPSLISVPSGVAAKKACGTKQSPCFALYLYREGPPHCETLPKQLQCETLQ